MSIKSSNDTTGNRIRDLPACTIVPQPTAPPRAPLLFVSKYNLYKSLRSQIRVHIVYTHVRHNMETLVGQNKSKKCHSSALA